MRQLTYLLLLLGIVISACQNIDEPINQDESTKIEIAKNKFREASKTTNKRDNWLALTQITEAEKLYEVVSHPSENFNKYLLHRMKALLLNREKLYALAASSMDTAQEFLEEANTSGHEMNYEKELVSTLRYKASYLRNDQQYQASSNIIFDLLKKDEAVKGLHAQLKNRLGRNYYDLFKYEEAYYMFDDILKISDLDPKNKAHYLQNRAQAAYKIGKKLQAFSDMSEAIGINESLGRDLYSFTTRMDMGELYLLENDNERALDNFDRAMSQFKEIDQDPDLFKIYNLRWMAARSLNKEEAAVNQRVFDSLSFVHQSNVEKYTAKQQYAMLAAGLDNVGFELQKEHLFWNLIPNWLVYTVASLALIFTVYFSITYIRRRRIRLALMKA